MPEISVTAPLPPTRGLPAALPEGTPASLDRQLHAWQSQFTGGRSPSTLALAWLDWLAHAANSPFQTADLGRTALAQWVRLARVASGQESPVLPAPDDHRFADPAWRQPPFDLMTQAAMLGEAWWASAVRCPGGVAPANARMVAFTTRQILDLLSPSNLPWLNPEVIQATRTTGGRNLLAGLSNFLTDQSHHAESGFQIGRDLAATPGKVVYRNALIELLQYTPSTAKVGAEPVLIVPAWIMKYYILDLSPENSLVRWLVNQGHTVFMISWRNPGTEMRDTPLDAYRSDGVMAALGVVQSICGPARIHATGYCLGGTLLTIAAAAMARDGDHRLASLSLFASQTDFTEAGELQLFITEDQLEFLDDMMETRGFLTSEQMGGAFQMLRSNDLIWSHMIRAYMLGRRDAPFDLMAWNADGTRMPARMHIEYLRSLFLHNALAEGRFDVAGRPLAINDIRLPMFVVSTEHDHIAPWHSVFKLHLLNDGELTFVLTSGGHNAGIVSEPGHAQRHFRLRMRTADARTLGPDEWLQETSPQPGSWWVEWGRWLASRSSAQVDPPLMGIPGQQPLGDAPGTYILES